MQCEDINMIREYDYLFKIVIIGNSSVGKSSLLRRFSDDQFQESYLATIGVDFRFKSLNIANSEVKLQIWDTAGQERFRTITSAYYKGAHGIIIVYDVTSEQSFADIQDFWIGEVEKYAEPNVVLSIIGNKSDCPDKFPADKVLLYCQQKRVAHGEVSAKTGEAVTKAFCDITQKLIKIHPKAEKKELATSQVVANVLRKKNEFKLKSGGQSKHEAQKKKCC